MRVVIVDDHPVVREGIEKSLSNEEDIEVVGKAATCPEGIELIAAEKPDVAIIDLKLPGGSGIDLLRQARKRVEKCKYIILTSFASDSDISEAVSEEVEGYILKGALPEEIISAVRLVAKGRRYCDPEVVSRVMKAKENNPLKELSKRERDVLESLGEGLNNKEISEKLYISENTVKTHLRNILSKLEMQDRTQLALFAYSQKVRAG